MAACVQGGLAAADRWIFAAMGGTLDAPMQPLVLACVVAVCWGLAHTV